MRDPSRTLYQQGEGVYGHTDPEYPDEPEDKGMGDGLKLQAMRMALETINSLFVWCCMGRNMLTIATRTQMLVKVFSGRRISYEELSAPVGVSKQAIHKHRKSFLAAFPEIAAALGEPSPQTNRQRPNIQTLKARTKCTRKTNNDDTTQLWLPLVW